MSRKTLRCYEIEIRKGNTTCDIDTFSDIIKIIFDGSQNDNAKSFDNGNGIVKFISEKGESYSLELINKIKNTVIEEDFLFIRIGKQKDIDGFVKRNKTTLLGEEVLDKDDQKIYELEVCTYMLIELKNGILLEMHGQFAPNINMFMQIVNSNLELIDDFNSIRTNISYKNIVSDKMIETFKVTGNNLKKIGYTYSIPSAEKLEKLGLDLRQVQALNLIGGLELEFIIKSKPRLPLTKKNEIIRAILESFKGCAKEIKDTLFFEGGTKYNSNQKFTFNEDEVTYNLDISYYKNEDNIKIPLDLYEIEEQVYDKIKNKYVENREDILNYIYK